MPLLANYQSTPFNPFNLLFTIFPSLKLLDWLILLKLTLLWIFSYLFATEIRLSPISAGTSALVICFSGYISITVNYISITVNNLFINSDLWLPSGLLIVERIFKTRATLFRFALLGIITSMCLLGGNPESAFYFLLFILLYSAIRGGWKRRKELLVILLSFGLGIALSSFQVWSFLEYMGFSWHIHSNQAYLVDQPSLSGLLSLFIPSLFGPSRFIDKFDYVSDFVGLIPVLLAVMTLSGLKRVSMRWFFSGSIFWFFSD